MTPFQTDADATIRLAVAAEELGYAHFGSAEGWTHDAVVLLAQIAGVTSRIGLATTVLPVWSRTPAAIAMAAASLQRASDGRFALGLGAGSPPLVEGLHGITWQQPVDRMRSTLVAVRALLEGARLPLEREHVRALRLGAPPERRVPILLAALAPASVRLAGELADQWLPFLWARSHIPDGRILLAEGEAAAEDSTATEIAASVPLAIAQDEQTARQIAAGWLLAYVTRMGPLYPRMLRDHFGFAREVDALLDANRNGGPPQLPAAAERLARDVTVMGTYEEASDAVRAWLAAGADTIDLVLPRGVPVEQLHEMLEAAAPAAASSGAEQHRSSKSSPGPAPRDELPGGPNENLPQRSLYPLKSSRPTRSLCGRARASIHTDCSVAQDEGRSARAVAAAWRFLRRVGCRVGGGPFGSRDRDEPDRRRARGREQRRPGADLFRDPSGIALDSRGNLLVTETTTDRTGIVVRLAPGTARRTPQNASAGRERRVTRRPHA